MKSSTALINAYLDRVIASGQPQKAVAHALGFEPNYLSMLRKGEPLPLPRVYPFAAAAGLSESERDELMQVRLLELDGGRGDFCVDSLTVFFKKLFAPTGNLATVAALWNEAEGAVPEVLCHALEDPQAVAELREVFERIVRREIERVQNV